MKMFRANNGKTKNVWHLYRGCKNVINRDQPLNFERAEFADREIGNLLKTEICRLCRKRYSLEMGYKYQKERWFDKEVLWAKYSPVYRNNGETEWQS